MILKRAHSGKTRASTYNITKYASAEGNTEKLVFAECYNTKSSYAFGDKVTDFCKKFSCELKQHNDYFNRKHKTRDTAIHDHFIVSLPLADRKVHEQMKEYMLEALEDAGWSRNRPFSVWGHDPKSGNHIDMHLISARRDFDGKGFNPNKINLILGKACSKIEAKYGLKKIDGDKFGVPLNQNNNRKEFAKERRLGKGETRKALRAALAIAAKKTDFHAFLKELRRLGITPLITLRGDLEDAIQGLRFIYQNQEFKSSSFTIEKQKMSYSALKKKYAFEDEDYLGLLKTIKEEYELDRTSRNMIIPDILSSNSRKYEPLGNPFRPENIYLEGIFFRDENDEYRFSKTGDLAFREEMDSIKVLNTSETAIRAALIVASKTLASDTLHLSGTSEFKRRAWIQYEILKAENPQIYKKKLYGYKPSPADYQQLEIMKGRLITSKNTITTEKKKAPEDKLEVSPKEQLLDELKNRADTANLRFCNRSKL